MFVLFIFLLIDNSHSLEWNCRANQISTEQCLIKIEYQQRQICSTNSLNIQILPPLTYRTNVSMKNFQLNFCQLVSLNQLPLTLPASVEELDLSDNLLSTFTLAFPLPSYLKSIKLDRNPNLIEIDFGSNRVHEKLIRLSLRHNHQVQFSSLPKNLLQLDLTDCHLSSRSWLLSIIKSLRKLTHLSFGENQLKQLPIRDQSLPLQYLNLSNNHLITIDNQWLNKHLRILDLSFNQIKSLEFFHEFLKQNRTTKILQLYLVGNPLICDCWFSAIRKSPQVNIIDRSLLSCQSNDYLCSYSRHCAADCTCCDFEACDCHSICPSDCSCTHDAFWTYHRITCERKNLSNIHLFLPETVTELNYEKNSIEQLKSFVFIGKIFLTKINLAKNNLNILTNETFCGAMNLREMNLSFNPNLKNLLSNLNDLFRCLKDLELIILSKEQIQSNESISQGWIMLSDKQLIYLKRMNLTKRTKTMTTMLVPIYHRETFISTNLIEYNQALIIFVFFLLVFILLFSILLILLAICRRKLRRHLNNEVQRQCYQANIHPKLPENPAANESLYEQLPSLSSDSEQPFLYPNPPALPPRLPSHAYYPYDYVQPSVLVLGNQLIYPNERVFLPSTLCQCHVYR